MYDKSNIFYKILQGEADCEKIYENKHAIVIKDKFPVTKIHNLVLPKKNYIDMKDFLKNASAEEKLSFLEAVENQISSMKDCKLIINVGKKAGQVVFHLHMHIQEYE